MNEEFINLLKQQLKQRRVILPTLRLLSNKRHKGTITPDEVQELEKIEPFYRNNEADIFESKKKVLLETYGQQVLSKWLEIQEIKSQPFTSASELGKRCKELERELSEVINFLESIV